MSKKNLNYLMHDTIDNHVKVTQIYPSRFTDMSLHRDKTKQEQKQKQIETLIIIRFLT